MPHGFFDHTGDIGIDIEAGDPGELFAEAARALTGIVTDPEVIAARESRHLRLAGNALDLLLVDWLSEVLYLFDADRWLVSRAGITIDGGPGAWTLDAALDGEPFDRDRHAIRLVPKAITYHALAVIQRAGVWQARVVIDV